ncbi:Emopamil binding protein-domain-containing protein [Microdochium trichocladiopsis]|uniref:Emopamil binding protein-domain-containing protein n=1 Tax=Microdochium trichocladiopsis TaxID=1682393 RepID=A0A9P8YIX0_9PEZI|nr:Emopamil binding protein-domain-containing protein [Microdochium trichocladiopsis]KAH7041090.1 Emopamil binding protein-domain-containing protein [Microdochium trichocladiopsis]
MGAFDNIVSWWVAAQGRVNDTAAAAVPLEPLPPQHPYFPQDLVLSGYVENETPLHVLLASFAGMLGCTILATGVLARKVNPQLTASSLAVVSWFVMCGCLHCFFEGYFVANHATIVSSQHLFSQLWKEYALSDSRYLISDPFMLSVEAITVVVLGPLSFLSAASTVLQSPLRHPLRMIVCIAHLFSVSLYYSTSLTESYFTGRWDSRPEPQYFWLYYVGFNLPWAAVPLVLLNNSIKSVVVALRAVERMAVTLDESKSLRDGKGTAELEEKKAE